MTSVVREVLLGDRRRVTVEGGETKRAFQWHCAFLLGVSAG